MTCHIFARPASRRTFLRGAGCAATTFALPAPLLAAIPALPTGPIEPSGLALTYLRLHWRSAYSEWEMLRGFTPEHKLYDIDHMEFSRTTYARVKPDDIHALFPDLQRSRLATELGDLRLCSGVQGTYEFVMTGDAHPLFSYECFRHPLMEFLGTIHDGDGEVTTRPFLAQTARGDGEPREFPELVIDREPATAGA